MIAKRITTIILLTLLLYRVSTADEPATRIALIGDSTVASYDKPPPDRLDLTGWGQVFGEFFDSRVEIRNFAQSGRSSKSFIGEGPWKPVLDAKPDFVFIQFGHNDQHKDDRGTEPDKEFQSFLRQYIDESRTAKITPVLITPVARRTFENGKVSTSLQPYADAMKKIGRDKQVTVIDLHTASLELFGRLGDEGSADLTASASDRTHFSRKGGRAIARLVANALPSSVPGLNPFLKETALTGEPGPAKVPGLVRLALPPLIFAPVGIEANVYFDNVVLVLNPTNYAFDAQCSKGRQQNERWTFIPQPADVGDHPFQLEIRNARNEVIARDRSVVRVIPSDAAADKKVSLLMIGDSLTHASVYPQRLAALCEKPGNPILRLIGTHGPGGVPGAVRHEGYGGWTAQRFATHAVGTPRSGDYSKRASPFLYPTSDGKPVLDIAAYCRDVDEGRLPEFVTIFLGPNDIFVFNDTTIEGGIRTMLENYDLLIGMVHRAAPKTKIGVMLPVPPAAMQDAFGSNYATGQTRWQYKRNQHRLLERMIEHYGSRESEQIYLVPTHVNLDCLHNYPEESVNWNGDNEAKGLRQNNGVHPAASGYHQIGDSVYAWLKGSVE